MSIVSGLRYVYLAWFSQPKGARALYRLVAKKRVASVLEIGLVDVRRSVRLLELAARRAGEGLRFAAIDQFEMRPPEHGSPLPLKEAHRQLRGTGAQARLLPGDPYSALARGANGLGTFDLVIVAACQNDDCLARAWFYVPRLLHERSQVLLEQVDESGKLTGYKTLTRAEVETLAQPPAKRKAA